MNNINQDRDPNQVKAELKYREKRKGKPQIPPVYISDEQKVMTDKVFIAFPGNKKEAILYALSLLAKELNVT